ncbi:hypothetical protein [Streptomyces albus]|uniref:hypothetical protein n=1 Tax=Streptomyces albus TaxID=1888 RepID=UPI00131AFDA0|nr:hypothetical protein [Streptomyces albus]
MAPNRLVRRLAALAAAVGLVILVPATAQGDPTATARTTRTAQAAQGTQSDPGAPGTASERQGAAVERTTTVRYGAYTIPASAGEEHGEISNRIALNVEKPCTNCFITSVKPNLVYEDGSNANVNTGPMLHHMVLFKGSATDVTCSRPGQRIFASGNERVESVFPDGYGIKVGSGERWTMLYDLMNHADTEKTVHIELTFTHESALFSGRKALTPLWMDAGGCRGSEFEAPEGVSEKSWTWTSTVSGELIHMRGHLHHGGTAVKTENLTTGRLLCESVAEEGGTPEFIDLHGRTEISDMSSCTGTPLGAISRGDELRITSRYELTGHSHHGVMGIMVGWIARS